MMMMIDTINMYKVRKVNSLKKQNHQEVNKKQMCPISTSELEKIAEIYSGFKSMVIFLVEQWTYFSGWL